MNDNLWFVDKTRNDKFSNLKGIELQELIVHIQNYFLTFRDSLELNESVTLGFEIECEEIPFIKTQSFLRQNYSKWLLETDGSLTNGGEVKTPILHDEYKYWQEVKKVCLYLKEHNVNTSRKAGGHIHVGSQILGDNVDYWRQFLKVYSLYESVLFRFFCGDKTNPRAEMLHYAAPISNILFGRFSKMKKCKTIKEIYDEIPKIKNHAINFLNVKCSEVNSISNKNTIEFRSPNATVEEVIWQNNANAITKMLLAPKKGYIDEDLIDHKLGFERLSTQKDIYLYFEINLKMVLDFVDLIFDNNLDKTYFLRQYFKDFNTSYVYKENFMAKKFVR